MIIAKPVNLLVFRETRERVSTRTLVDELVRALETLDGAAQGSQKILNALIRAGELECGLGDASSAAADYLAGLTDRLAKLLLAPKQREDVSSSIPDLAALPLPETLLVSPPEGFAYYALHPLDFARFAARLDVSGPAAVVGIRSIGTVLSAVVKAALEQQATAATRITVRPSGHPYDRVTQFSAEQTRWVDEQRQRRSQFIVVDEGPGLSGSSFLSVGEALIRQGIPSKQILFLGTRKPESLCSRDAANRSREFNWMTVQPDSYRSLDNCEFFGGGAWRASCFEDPTEWPASWTQLERLKFLSADRRRLLKFEGLGRFGQRVTNRAERVAEAGFGPGADAAGDGLVKYEFIEGKPLRAAEVSPQILERLARYCAFRSNEFQVNGSPSALSEMARFNCAQEFGVECALSDGACEVIRPVIVDGRMQPHEWIMRNDGTIFKVDAAAHGDDHFFPGPTDIAWDLAGSIVEWNLNEEAAEFLISRYAQLSGDNPLARMPGFMLAYAIFRLSYCRMAENAVQDSHECARLQRAHEYYRTRVARQLAKDSSLPALVGSEASGGSSA